MKVISNKKWKKLTNDLKNCRNELISKDKEIVKCGLTQLDYLIKNVFKG